MSNPTPAGNDRAERCATCGRKVPDWPAGWLRTDDGVNLCPDHKAGVTLLRTKL